MNTKRFMPLLISRSDLAPAWRNLWREPAAPAGTFGEDSANCFYYLGTHLSYRYLQLCSADTLSSICGGWMCFSMLLQIMARGTATPAPYKFSCVKYIVFLDSMYSHSRKASERKGNTNFYCNLLLVCLLPKESYF